MKQICEFCGKEIIDSHKRKYCSSKCMAQAFNAKAEADFMVKFNEKFVGRYVYVSGYIGSESDFLCKCVICGSKQLKNAQCIRRGHTDIKCGKCATIEAGNRLANEKLQQETKREQKAKEKEEHRDARLYSTCRECGSTFKGNRAGLRYCSDKCKRKHGNRYHEINRREKLKKNGKVDYSISLQRIAKRDKYICHICGELVDMKIDTNADMYGSIDHVMPVSKGGTHTWDNVKLAHRICNTIKRDT